MQELIVLVKQLREDVAHQRNEITHLRSLIENCAGCKERPEPVRETCKTHSPCFPGVQCHDTSTGMRCGRCPRGYVGNGQSCQQGVTCADRPCFQWVIFCFYFIFIFLANYKIYNYNNQRSESEYSVRSHHKPVWLSNANRILLTRYNIASIAINGPELHAHISTQFCAFH